MSICNNIFTLKHNIIAIYITEEEVVGFVGWIIIGALAGWIASMFTGNNLRMGCFMNIIVGVFGELIGGFLMNLAGGYGMTGFNLWSLFVATIGAVVLLLIVNALRRR
jgi:uncharacterized membrane protein YeaQ/YmgE (transglycosylase-associated protein family)